MTKLRRRKNHHFDKKPGKSKKKSKFPVEKEKPQLKQKTKKEKIYNLSFNAIIKEFIAIQNRYFDIDDNYDNYSITDLKLLDNVNADEDYLTFIANKYQELLDPLILSMWMLFPAEFYKYLKEIATADQQTLAIDKIVQVTTYGTEQLEFEFPEVKRLPDKFFPGMRQYYSLVVIIENTFTENRNYDLLLEVITNINDGLIELINSRVDGSFAKLNDLELLWISNLLCELEETLPEISDIEFDQISEALSTMYEIAEERDLIEIMSIIEFNQEYRDVLEIEDNLDEEIINIKSDETKGTIVGEE